jgi:hypothetical protein
MIQNKYKRWPGSVLLFSLFLLFMNAGTVFSQSSANYKIKESVLDQGGAPSLSANFKTVDVIGQPSPVTVANSANYSVASGFLGGEEAVQTPGLLVNGNFSNGNTGWLLFVDPSATANGSVQNGEYAVSITNGSTVDWHIQLIQSNLLIENGKSYSLLFEAYAASPRQIAFYIRKASAPHTAYSGYQTFALTASKQDFSFTFKMNDPTDSKADFSFVLGISNVDVFFDNITLTEPTTVADDPGESASLPTDFNLLQNYPNPFNPATTIGYRLPQSSEVALTIYDLQGHQVRMLDYGIKAAGHHSVKWDGRNKQGLNVTSGIYFYRIEMRTENGIFSFYAHH